MARIAQRLLSLRRLIFGALTLVTLIPLAVFWLWPFSKAVDDDLDKVAQAHLLIARNMGAALDRYYTDVVTVFDLISTNLVAGKDPGEVEPLFRSMEFRHFCIADRATGEVVASVYQGQQLCPAWIPAPRFAALLAMASDDGVTVSPVSEGPDGEPLIYLVRSFGDRLAVAALMTDYFVTLGEQVAFGEKGHAAIVDATGRVIAHPRADWRMERRDLSGLSIVRQMMAGQTGVTEFYSPAQQTDMIAGYTVAPLSGWGVMVPQPKAELQAEASAIQDTALGVFALGLAAALLASWVLSGLLTGPLRQFLQLTRSFSTAHASERVAQLPWYAPQELSTLATSFNAMLARIGEATEKMVHAQHRAEESNRAKSEFMAKMSHELRTPLNAIVGFSDALEHGIFGEIVDERQREYIHFIHASSLHLRDLIEDIMDISRIEAGVVEVHETEFALAETVANALGLVQPDADAKGVALSAELGTQPPMLYGDTRQVAQILINLLGNAIKFTPGPDGRVSVRARPAPDGDLLLTVADTGIGIPAHQIGEMLQPFRRGDEPYAQEQPGTGLGLAIVQKLVERHDGRLAIASRVGVGTEVTIRWPKGRIRPGMRSQVAAEQGGRQPARPPLTSPIAAKA